MPASRCDAHRQREVAHARLRARAVGDVDDVDAARLEHLRRGDGARRDRARPAGSPRPRRRTACARSSPPARSAARTATGCDGAGQDRPAHDAPVDVRARELLVAVAPRSTLAHAAGHARGRGDALDVLRRRSAAAADEAHADAEHAARVDAEVLGGRHVDHALVDPARETGVRRREHRAGRRAPSSRRRRARPSARRSS